MLRIGWERSPVVAFNTGVISMVFVKDDQKNLTQVQLAVPVCLRAVTAAFVLEPSQDFHKAIAHTVSVPPKRQSSIRFVLLNATSSFYE